MVPIVPNLPCTIDTQRSTKESNDAPRFIVQTDQYIGAHFFYASRVMVFWRLCELNPSSEAQRPLSSSKAFSRTVNSLKKDRIRNMVEQKIRGLNSLIV
ncbi:hypothetical protein M413DRAFT_441024, partial [Hebeloma cylindrosporum]